MQGIFFLLLGLDIDWCKAPEAGLLKPDLVVFLQLSVGEMAKRGGYGEERLSFFFEHRRVDRIMMFFHIRRYELPEFQQRVFKVYELLKDSKYWKTVDADKTQDDLHKELYGILEKTIDQVDNQPMETLW